MLTGLRTANAVSLIGVDLWRKGMMNYLVEEKKNSNIVFFKTLVFKPVADMAFLHG